MRKLALLLALAGCRLAPGGVELGVWLAPGGLEAARFYMEAKRDPEAALSRLEPDNRRWLGLRLALAGEELRVEGTLTREGEAFSVDGWKFRVTNRGIEVLDYGIPNIGQGPDSLLALAFPCDRAARLPESRRKRAEEEGVLRLLDLRPSLRRQLYRYMPPLRRAQEARALALGLWAMQLEEVEARLGKRRVPREAADFIRDSLLCGPALLSPDEVADTLEVFLGRLDGGRSRTRIRDLTQPLRKRAKRELGRALLAGRGKAPGDPKLQRAQELYWMGVEAYTNEEYRKALSLFSKAQRLDPENEDIREALERTREMLGR